jgi:hypothetical protein
MMNEATCYRTSSGAPTRAMFQDQVVANYSWPGRPSLPPSRPDRPATSSGSTVCPVGGP